MIEKTIGEALKKNLKPPYKLDEIWKGINGRPYISYEKEMIDRLTKLIELLEEINKKLDILCQKKNL